MSTTSTMNIALPEPMRAYVAKRVESGQFGNTSEYVRELIRRDQREQDIARLRAMVEVGLASGPVRVDTAEDWAELEAIARGTKAGLDRARGLLGPSRASCGPRPGRTGVRRCTTTVRRMVLPSPTSS